MRWIVSESPVNALALCRWSARFGLPVAHSPSTTLQQTKPGTVGDYIDDLGPGDVAVLDNEGRADATIWGDLPTSTAHRRGVEEP
jgi:regulator of ribonuclease E activity RraA/HMG-CHA aldolase family protein